MINKSISVRCCICKTQLTKN